MSRPAEPRSAVQVRIYGRVQGVWFRAWTTQEATALELAGWVRNRADGSVEALFVGPADDVETMIAKCHVGPPVARVDEVVREALSSSEVDVSVGGFRQLSTV